MNVVRHRIHTPLVVHQTFVMVHSSFLYSHNKAAPFRFYPNNEMYYKYVYNEYLFFAIDHITN